MMSTTMPLLGKSDRLSQLMISRILFVAAGVLIAVTGWAADEPPSAASTGHATAEFISAALTPIWRADEISDSFLFIQGKDDQLPTAKLLFTPTEILSVESATREKKFAADKDYQLDLTAGTIQIPRGSAIPVVTQEQLYPLMTSDSPKIARIAGDKTRGIFFGEGSAYQQRQVVVKYRFKPGQWSGPIPKYAGDALPKTMAKLRAKAPVNLVLCGDSISQGYNASQFTKTPPGCPPYGELTALALETAYGSKVAFTNYAIAGWTSQNGLEQARDKHIGKAGPDLVIIAFGMNDVFQRDAAKYKKNVQAIMETVRADAPDAEFILVASMLGNAEWGMPTDQFLLYRDALAELCGPGAVLADLTSIWEALLKRKSFYDLTGNGVNHPNDFGHFVYAQTLLALLVDKQK